MLVAGLEIIVTIARPDQVFEAAPGTGFPSHFSGYVDVIAKKAGHAPVKGTGLLIECLSDDVENSRSGSKQDVLYMQPVLLSYSLHFVARMGMCVGDLVVEKRKIVSPIQFRVFA